MVSILWTLSQSLELLWRNNQTLRIVQHLNARFFLSNLQWLASFFNFTQPSFVRPIPSVLDVCEGELFWIHTDDAASLLWDPVTV
jgi:hypothetical protein